MFNRLVGKFRRLETLSDYSPQAAIFLDDLFDPPGSINLDAMEVKSHPELEEKIERLRRAQQREDWGYLPPEAQDGIREGLEERHLERLKTYEHFGSEDHVRELHEWLHNNAHSAKYDGGPKPWEGDDLDDEPSFEFLDEPTMSEEGTDGD